MLVSRWKIGQYCSLFSSAHISACSDTPGCPSSCPQRYPSRVKAHSISRNTTTAHIICSPEQPPALSVPRESLWMLLYSGGKHPCGEINLLGNLVHERCFFIAILLPNKFPEGKSNINRKIPGAKFFSGSH